MSNENKKPPVLEVVKGAKSPKATQTKPTGSSGGGTGSGSKKALRFGEYGIENGAFVQFKMMRIEGSSDRAENSFPLCDFTCRVVEEVIADDGLTDTSFLRLEGRRADGVALPLVDIPAKSFYATQGNWANEYWGTLPFIYPGAAKKDNLRACIQLYSRLEVDIPRRTIYRFTGWKKFDNEWRYLTGSGAIAAAGLVDDVQVDLGLGNMSRYRLPAPLSGDTLKQAATDALLLLEVCPHRPHIGAVLLAAAVRAPLGEAHCIDFAIWLHGLTGSRKSAIAAIPQAFFGNFTARSFPANWTDSANDAEAKSYQAKDAIYVIDDFKPSVNRHEADKQHSMAERLIRNTGNQAGRGRRSANMQAQAAPFNRSMMIVTAEDLPRGQSLLGRMLVQEISRDDVNNATLSKLQHSANSGALSGLMSNYLQWLASCMDQHKKDFPTIIEQLRNGAVREGIASAHPRSPEIFANLVAGLEPFLMFLEEIGAIDGEKSNRLLIEIERHLKQAFSEQTAYQAEQDEVERFLQLLRSCFSSGNAHIASRIDQGPPQSRPFAWGWREAGADLVGDKQYKLMGDCIGWYSPPTDGAPPQVWLEPNSAFKTVNEFAKRQGDAFLMSPGTLWRRMIERGLLLKLEQDAARGKPRPAVKHLVAGRSVRVLVLDAALIESGG
ncbi:cell wall-binding protein [Methylomonas rhizoryzae]|uniref:cell wall-binding protein n=1 Tax=Methylomonas rhizoryzae TaxID=2608981 RepID=UPI001231BD9F|nr:cell wall-binding protein [Methylomonas rhizoryzae]